MNKTAHLHIYETSNNTFQQQELLFNGIHHSVEMNLCMNNFYVFTAYNGIQYDDEIRPGMP